MKWGFLKLDFPRRILSSKKTLDRLDRDVFEAKLWLKRTCRRGAHQNRAIAPSRCDPTSSIVYSCCNRAPGIFPHSYGNVLGLIERNQLGFGIYLLQVSVLQWKNQLATLNHIVVPMTSISHLIEPKTYYDRAPQTWQKPEEEKPTRNATRMSFMLASESNHKTFACAAHCLKITQNVALEFLNFDIFHQFLSYQNWLVW